MAMNATADKPRHRARDLRQARVDAGLTLDQVREITGIHRSQLSRMESGQASVNLARLRQLALLYGLDETAELLAPFARAEEDDTA